MRTLLVVSCLAALACGVVMPAGASPPTPANSTVPSLIPILGHNASGLPDPFAEVRIVFRDIANDPIPNALIVLDFSACTELRLCADSHEPGVTVDCATRTVSRLTDATGTALFRVMGWSVAPPGSPGAPSNSGKIFGDGTLLASPSVAIYDLDTRGLGASDLSAWLADFFSGNNPARSDYDDTRIVGASDLSMWLKAYFASGSPSNCTPEGPCP